MKILKSFWKWLKRLFGIVEVDAKAALVEVAAYSRKVEADTTKALIKAEVSAKQGLVMAENEAQRALKALQNQIDKVEAFAKSRLL
jgi:hypothetical protein